MPLYLKCEEVSKGLDDGEVDVVGWTHTPSLSIPCSSDTTSQNLAPEGGGEEMCGAVNTCFRRQGSQRGKKWRDASKEGFFHYEGKTYRFGYRTVGVGVKEKGIKGR